MNMPFCGDTPPHLQCVLINNTYQVQIKEDTC